MWGPLTRFAKRGLDWQTAARRRVARTPLSVSVSLAVLTGFVLAVVVTIAIGCALGTKPSLDVLRTALTVVAGVGGAVALVVAYRRQKDLEQGRFVERFGAAAAQLGDPDAAVRMAGVYAMAGVADGSRDFAPRQQCIDVLCGYLRLPYEPEQGKSHRTELVTTTKRQALPPITSVEEQVHQRLRQNDSEVRQTIVRIIASHVQSGTGADYHVYVQRAETNWSRHDYDFTGVIFEDANFGGAAFNGKTSFDKATFTGEVTYFGGATSTSETTFAETTFNSKVTGFNEATFNGTRTSFWKATFNGLTTSFDKATFNSETTYFDKATFNAGTSFGRAAFNGETTSFRGAIFSGNFVFFGSPRAWHNVSFDWDRPLGADNGEAAPAAVMPECIQPREWPPQVKASSD